jgi:hypothetical protein
MDVRLTLRTAAGALIYLAYTGVRTGPPAVLARLAAGEAVPPADYYFRIAARFETAAPELAWLNHTLADAHGQRPPSGPTYDLYAIR